MIIINELYTMATFLKKQGFTKILNIDWNEMYDIDEFIDSLDENTAIDFEIRQIIRRLEPLDITINAVKDNMLIPLYRVY